MTTSIKEIWKQIPFPKGNLIKKYAISTKGRIASYEKDINDLFILKTSKTEGYDSITLRQNGKSSAVFIHKAMAMAFIKKNSLKHKIVLHLDFDKTNNDLSNLKWATPKEAANHVKNSPNVLNAIKYKVHTTSMAKKLDEKKVIALKKEIWNPKRKITLSKLAAKYGIADMNLYRIKNGLFWFHVHVEGEPIFPKYAQQLKNIEYHAKKNAKLEVAKAKIDAAKAKIKAEKNKKRAKLVAEKLKAKKERLAEKATYKATRLAEINKKRVLKAKQRTERIKNRAKLIAEKLKEKKARMALTAANKAKHLSEKKLALKLKKNKGKKAKPVVKNSKK